MLPGLIGHLNGSDELGCHARCRRRLTCIEGHLLRRISVEGDEADVVEVARLELHGRRYGIVVGSVLAVGSIFQIAVLPVPGAVVVVVVYDGPLSKLGLIGEVVAVRRHVGSAHGHCVGCHGVAAQSLVCGPEPVSVVLCFICHHAVGIGGVASGIHLSAVGHAQQRVGHLGRVYISSVLTRFHGVPFHFDAGTLVVFRRYARRKTFRCLRIVVAHPSLQGAGVAVLALLCGHHREGVQACRGGNVHAD